MPSLSAPCQPASSQSSPARRRSVSHLSSARQSSPSPRPAEDLRGRGGETSTRHRTRLTPSGRARRDYSSGEGRTRARRRRDRASSCAVCNRDVDSSPMSWRSSHYDSMPLHVILCMIIHPPAPAAMRRVSKQGYSIFDLIRSGIHDRFE
jgi:hypothetical protein